MHFEKKISQDFLEAVRTHMECKRETDFTMKFETFYLDRKNENLWNSDFSIATSFHHNTFSKPFKMNNVALK